uniref:Uncharacterized protein n=1 Tax=Heterorhabditis bacteriophora TaxID=37862 RepID=A0A1I7W9I5_HETBA
MFQFGANVGKLLIDQRLVRFYNDPQLASSIAKGRPRLLIFKALVSVTKSLKPMSSCTFVDGSLAKCLVNIANSFRCFAFHFELIDRNCPNLFFPFLILCLKQPNLPLFLHQLNIYEISTLKKAAVEIVVKCYLLHCISPITRDDCIYLVSCICISTMFNQYSKIFVTINLLEKIPSSYRKAWLKVVEENKKDHESETNSISKIFSISHFNIEYLVLTWSKTFLLCSSTKIENYAELHYLVIMSFIYNLTKNWIYRLR